MKTQLSFNYVLTGLLFLSMAAAAWLYNENLSYKKACKELILQNDSILSANIELKQILESKAANAALTRKRK
jgi:hypothetical protein